jgi:2-oxoglutarate dehydrogenase E1 component
MKRMMDNGRFSFANGANASFVDNLYQDYRANPESVEESWRQFFEGFEFALASRSGQLAAGEGELEAKVEAFINLYRRLGHLSAHLNPLAEKPRLADFLEPQNHGLGDVAPGQMFHPANIPYEGPVSFEDIQNLLRETYCGPIGADFRDINDIDAVTWFQEKMESCRNRPQVEAQVKMRIFDKLTQAEGFEKFLQDRYLGQKRFSIEGLEAMIPLLDSLSEDAQQSQVEEICLGMAHRGRLNVLANFLGKPYELMLKEFEGSDMDSYGIDGDVKYHKGFASYVKTMSGETIRVYLSPNPSHLESVNPVVEGFTRARQEMMGDHDRSRVLPILIHGDASFMGQGIVAETLNLSALPSYETGGTVHIIANNQVGFTTDPHEGRSCRYSSEIAKMVRAPVLHVNADDPEAVIWTAKLALEFRQKFKKDVVIDLIGYRRHGHNETDEPSFTQPQLYSKIKNHPTVLQQYTQTLVEQGVLGDSDGKSRYKEFRAYLQECLEKIRKENVEILPTIPKELESSTRYVKATEEETFKPVKTSVSKEVLTKIADATLAIPEGFKPHPKVEKLFYNRRKMMAGEGQIDWGLAEFFTYGSLALEGRVVRLSGQDSQRGTFSHRHAVIRNYDSGIPLPCLNQIPDQEAPVHVINSPLSEQGCMGFEFGYSVANRDALVLWEAQFGDFCNGAQIIIDQFLAASEAKWKQNSGLVLLLPHGYEGMGPEHSSARPERFLQLCGDNNIQVANPTSPSQLFHMLRRQMHRNFRKPLIVMTPKSLLRHPKCVSTIQDFTDGKFQEVLDDDRLPAHDQVERIVFCSGKIYYDMDKMRDELEEQNKVAIVRIEQLYPFPEHRVDEIIKSYPNSKEVIWAQEEPSNMGAWTFIRHRIKQLCTRSRHFRYAGRPSAGTTAEGSVHSHAKEQRRLILDALAIHSAEKESSEAKSQSQA